MSTIFYSIPGVRLAQTKLNQLTSYIPPPPPESSGKRRILLVHTHPDCNNSFSAAIAKSVEEGAVAAGHEIKMVNLNAHANPSKCYRPNLGLVEKQNSFDLQVDKTKPRKVESEVRQHLDLLKWCDTLVLVYPTWWMNTPASLKGFFDRTMVQGIAWTYPSKDATLVSSMGMVPLLTNIERIYGISTYGGSQTIVTLAGDNGRRMISNAIRHTLSPNATVTWMGLYSIHSTTPEKRTDFLNQVQEMVKDM